MSSFDYESIVTRLNEPGLTIVHKAKIIVDLRDTFEFYLYDNTEAVGRLLPILLKMLDEESVSFVFKALEQKLRATLLDIINRLPFNEAFRPYALSTAKTLYKVYELDNEDNAIAALKIIGELFRAYKIELKDLLSTYFEGYKNFLNSMEQIVTKSFDNPNTPSSSTPHTVSLDTPTTFSPNSDQETAKKIIPRGINSFKVLSEYTVSLKPLNILYKDIIYPYLELVFPSLFQFLKLQANPQLEAHQRAKQEGDVFVGIAKEIKNKTLFSDFIVAQIKVLSYMSNLHKAGSYSLSSHFVEFFECFIRLVCDCPPDQCYYRKDVLFTIQCLGGSPEAGPVFCSHIDTLLNDKIMGFNGVYSNVLMQVLSFTMVAEIVKYFRNSITLPQFKLIVDVYVNRFLEPNISLSVQRLCTKPLPFVIESISQHSDKGEVRSLLIKIFNALVTKLGTISQECKNLQNLLLKYQKVENIPNLPSISALSSDNIENMDLNYIRPYSTPSKTIRTYAELVKDLRGMLGIVFDIIEKVIKPLVLLSNTAPIPITNIQKVAGAAYTCDNVNLFIKLFRDTISCISIYAIEHNFEDKPIIHHSKYASILPTTPEAAEVQEILKILIYTFDCMEIPVFIEVFTLNVEYYFESFVNNPYLGYIAQILLNNTTLEQHFACITFEFLTNKLDLLGTASANYINVSMFLFRISLHQVSQYPIANEALLNSFATKIIRKCLNHASNLERCYNYYFFMNAFYECLPPVALEKVLNVTMNFFPQLTSDLSLALSTTTKEEFRDLIIELSLTLCSTIAPYAPFLRNFMKPICMALSLNDHLVIKALKTLDFCIDGIDPSNLEATIAPNADELSYYLWKHIKPSSGSQNASNYAMRVLGKLGPCSRLFLQHSPIISTEDNMEEDMKLMIEFEGKPIQQGIPIKRIAKTAHNCLQDPSSDPLYKLHSIKFLKAIFSSMINMDHIGNKELYFIKSKVQVYFEKYPEINGSSNKFSYVVPSLDINNKDDINLNQNLSLSRIVGKIATQRPESKKESLQAEILKQIFGSLFIAASNPDLYQEAWPVLEGICSYYSLIKIAQLISTQSNSCPLNPDIITNNIALDLFFNSLLETCISEHSNLRKLGMDTIKVLEEKFVYFLGGSKHLHKLPFFLNINEALCNHCCSEEIYKKDASAKLLMFLIEDLSLGSQWLLEHEMEVFKSLLIALKSVPHNILSPYSDQISNSLQKLIIMLYGPNGVRCEEMKFENSEGLDKSHSLSKYLELVLKELFSSNFALREASKSLIKLFTKLTNMEIPILLKNHPDKVTELMFGKAMRALPFSIMIGSFDGVSFLLDAKCTFLDGVEHLPGFIAEVLALLDSDDSLYKAIEAKDEDLMTRFRTKAIQVILSAIRFLEISASPDTLKARAQRVFFRFLPSNSTEISDAASAGLKEISGPESKFSKEVLSEVLKPYLNSLTDHATLNTSYLNGLARVLDILTHYFKVEVGTKLLANLKQWGDENMLKMLSFTRLNEVNELKIIVGILNVFSLLPAAASIFVKELVPFIVKVETLIKRNMASPLRAPMLAYLSRHPVETIDFCFSQFDDINYAKYFANILTNEKADKLRLEIISSPEKLIMNTIERPNSPILNELRTQFVKIVDAISQFHPDFLPNSPKIINECIKLWRSFNQDKRPESLDDLVLIQFKEYRVLMNIFIRTLQEGAFDSEIFLELSSSLYYKTFVSFEAAKSYYKEWIIHSSSKIKYQVFRKFMDVFDNPNYSREFITTFLKQIVNPMILVSFYKGYFDEVVTDDILNTIHQKIWLGLEINYNNYGGVEEDYYRLEIIHLSILIIQHAPTRITSTKKAIIQFGFAHSKLDDEMVKQNAHYLMAKFITFFTCPDNIVYYVYGGLLRCRKTEIKDIVNMAIDDMIKVFQSRPKKTNEDSRYPAWIRFTKQIFLEESYCHPSLSQIFTMFERHSEVFNEYQVHFIPQALTILYKLPLPCTLPETRLLCVQIAEFVFKMEFLNKQKVINNGDTLNEVELEDEKESGSKRSVKNDEANNITNKKAKSEPSIMHTIPSTVTKDTFLNTNIRSQILKIIIRVYCSSDDHNSRKSSSEALTKIFTSFLTLDEYLDAPMALSWFDPGIKLGESDESQLQTIFAMELLIVMLKRRSKDWLDSHIKQLKEFLSPYIKANVFTISCSLHPIIKYVLNLLPGPDKLNHNPDSYPFQTLVESTISRGLGDSATLNSALILLDSISIPRPEVVDPLIPTLTRLLQRLCKDHVLSIQQSRTSQPAISKQHKWRIIYPFLANNKSEAITTPEFITQSIIMAINILKIRIEYLSDHRKNFLNALCLVLEKSNDNQLLRMIFNMIRDWLLTPTHSFPTLKEKANLLVCMSDIEGRCENSLLNDFLDLTLKVYSSPNFHNTELTMKLESAFLLGTRANMPKLKDQFLRLLTDSFSTKLTQRLKYIFSVQNWERMGEHYWIHQALYVLIGAINYDQTIRRFNFNAMINFPFRSLIGQMVNDLDEKLDGDNKDPILNSINQLYTTLNSFKNLDLFTSIQSLSTISPEFTDFLWVTLFPMCWASLTDIEKSEMTKFAIDLFCKPYHLKQSNLRPNVIQSLLAGFEKCKPTVLLPPHLVKYLGYKFCAWHTAIRLLDTSIIDHAVNHDKDGALIRTSIEDALSELYQTLNEEDSYYSLWSMRCRFPTTNIAISFAAQSLWPQALTTYENAQSLVSKLSLPTCESEFSMWEDEWVKCTQQLQKWDLIEELGETTGSLELVLHAQWQTRNLSENNLVFQDYLSRYHFINNSITHDFQIRFYKAIMFMISRKEVNEQSISEYSHLFGQATFELKRMWNMLPNVVSPSHFPYLVGCQQLYEIHTTSVLFSALGEGKQTDFDMLLSTLDKTILPWRATLPNLWDPIQVWQNVVPYRQQVFNKMNKALKDIGIKIEENKATPILSPAVLLQKTQYEQAYLLNRFARATRKQGLPKTSLEISERVYELPNIHISEAFFKLIEQAKCYFMIEGEAHKGLELLNKASINFFSPAEKVRYFILKGKFFTKLGLIDEANQAFSAATQMDLTVPKAWANWGMFNEKLYHEKKSIEYATYAVNCFNQAACIYKNQKSRKYIVRIINLLNNDDENCTVSKSFSEMKDPMPFWYWLSFIPQLMTFLTQKNASYIQPLLLQLVRRFPQAIYYHLLTFRDELVILRQLSKQKEGDTGTDYFKQAWELLVELTDAVKLHSPLYVITATTVADTLSKDRSLSNEEEILGLTWQMLNEGIEQLSLPTQSQSDEISSEQVHKIGKHKLNRCLELLNNDKAKDLFFNSFLKDPPNIIDFVHRMRKWKDHYELLVRVKCPDSIIDFFGSDLLDAESYSLNELLVPGQFLMDDDNYEKIKIMRFIQKVQLIRKEGKLSYIIGIRGYDGKVYKFVIDKNSTHNSRREERLQQFTALLNSMLYKCHDTAKRQLHFKFPVMLPIYHSTRISEYKGAHISADDILAQHCREIGVYPELPSIYYLQKIRSYKYNGNESDELDFKGNVLDEISEHIVPGNIIKKHFMKTVPDYNEYFVLQKTSNYQLACVSFLSFVLGLSQVNSDKVWFNLKRGDIYFKEALPQLCYTAPFISNNENVPFRLTANLQNLLTKQGVNGMFVFTLISLARAFSNVNGNKHLEFKSYLDLYLRSELWFLNCFGRFFKSDSGQNELIATQEILEGKAEDLEIMSKGVIDKVKFLECESEVVKGSIVKFPISKGVSDLVSLATNHKNLAKMGYKWAPWI